MRLKFTKPVEIFRDQACKTGFLQDRRQSFQRCASSGWFDPDVIVHRRSYPLSAAEIALGGLDRDVTQEKLDLL
jgi:hypothetical protein